MKKNIVIVHYNTPYLTGCLVRSINLFVKDAVIYIFDNSDKCPFTAEFDNVTIFDNTKGQIIDFDRWLENYPRKKLSNGKVNGWGSAKHCYSVEKCMELIGDNFFLLDSDILLKCDISELADDKYIYVGTVEVQPKSTINRVIPYLCYINVKMCMENNVHYFDDNYMHGLANNVKNPYSDRYDTGSGFYINASKLPHNEVDINKYMIHYGHGSWNKKGYKYHCTPEEWTTLNKRYWTNEMNKNVIYTCIIGEYDDIIEPSFITPGFDYICFTDNTNLESSIWDIRPIPEHEILSTLPKVKRQRFIKIRPDIFLKEYELSIWVDGNVVIQGDLNEFLSPVIEEDCSVYVPKHPSRSCIYAESKVVLAMKKDVCDNVNPQMERYKNECFPKGYGLLQSNILVRKHNSEDCIKLMKEWSNEVINCSHRDQLSFNYCSWKHQDVKVKYLDEKIYSSKWFHWMGIHGRRRKVEKSKSVKSTTGRTEVTKIEEIFNEKRNKVKKLLSTGKVNTFDVMIY